MSKVRPDTVGIVAFTTYTIDMMDRTIRHGQYKMTLIILNAQGKALQAHRDKPWYDQAEVS